MFNQISMKKSIFFLINITMIFIIDSLAIFPNIDHIVSNFCLVIYIKHGEIKKHFYWQLPMEKEADKQLWKLD